VGGEMPTAKAGLSTCIHQLLAVEKTDIQAGSGSGSGYKLRARCRLLCWCWWHQDSIQANLSPASISCSIWYLLCVY